jgi:OmpA-like transmembrane domain
MNRRLRVALAAVLLSGAGVSRAHAADGFYLGGGIGVATVRDNVNTETLDADDVAYKAFIGYRVNALPLIDLALEGAYTDFGRPSQTLSGQNVQFKLSGASAAGLLIVPLGPVDVYGKAGMMSWRSETGNGASTTGQSGTDPFYGVGVGFYFWKLGIRAEYERYQIKDVDRMQMLAVSALFQF